MSIETLVSKASNIIKQLQAFGFHHYIVTGCSLPKTIDLAASNHDSVGSVVRKEMVLWQALRRSFSNIIIVSGDYGVRGPTTTEARNKYMNGKIRHTTKKQVFVVRGHPFFDDHCHDQMYGLSTMVIESPHFLGGGFSWGDNQIGLVSRRLALGNPTKWIAIDTNHHLTFVVHEVEEFERDLSKRVVARSLS